ncbi:hypothetical protein LXA43DRAFT_1187382, partial [Ganoderma leucocontextum]
MRKKIVKAISHERPEFKHLWNRSLPINQLPAELLAQIFIMVVHFETYFTTSGNRRPRAIGWRSMAVCRHWHDFFIATPMLWCSVNPANNTNWTQLCLARSDTTPINFSVRVPYPCSPDRLRLMHPPVHRIKRLYFEIHTGVRDPDPDTLATIPLLFGNGMPVLAQLDFSITACRRYFSHFHMPIDVELTSRRFPHLQSLALTGVVAPRGASFYTQLRTLSLNTCSHNMSFCRFLDVLASCTRLEHLHLENTLDRLSGDWMHRYPASSSRPLISFPRLDTFELSGHGAVCTSRFLAHFHIQSSVRLRISADADADLDGSDGPLSIAAMLPPSYAVTLEPLSTAHDVLSMDMPADGYRWIRIQAGSAGPPAETVPAVSLSMQPVSWDARGPLVRSRRGTVSDLVELLGHPPVTSLSVDRLFFDTVEAWRDVFRAFPLLERLSVCGSRGPLAIANVFLGLHAASTADSDSGSPVAVACPSLANISLVGILSGQRG